MKDIKRGVVVQWCANCEWIDKQELISKTAAKCLKCGHVNGYYKYV